MSAMSASATELSQGPEYGSLAGRTPMARTQRRVERRAELKEARRDRRRCSIMSCAILGLGFALTAGILDVLH